MSDYLVGKGNLILIKDDWYIEIDEYSYNLQQFNGIYIDKKGNEIAQWKNQTYHPTLDKALWQYTQYKVRDALRDASKDLLDGITIAEAIKIIHEELKETREVISNATGGI